MSGEYRHHLESLRREIELLGARPAMIDAGIGKILALGDQRAAGDLLSLLSDNAEYDEGMFALIHAAESFEDGAYVLELLSILPRLTSSAPVWGAIVLMRVLNHTPSQLELVKQLRDAPASVKDSVREMCRRINEANPEFLNKTIPVTVAAGA